MKLNRSSVVIDIEQDTEEWLNHRQGGVGSSDVYLLFAPEGSFGRTAFSLWKDRVGYEKFEFVENPHTKRGKELEPFIRDEVNDLLGTNFKPQLMLRPDAPHLRASLDGIDFDYDAILEIKAPAEKSFLKMLEGIPDYYWYQMQYQMLVSNTEYGIFAFYNEKYGLKMQFVENDISAQMEIESRCELLWEGVEKKIPLGWKNGELYLFDQQPTIFVVICSDSDEINMVNFDCVLPVSNLVGARDDSFIFPCSDLTKLKELKHNNPDRKFKIINLKDSPFGDAEDIDFTAKGLNKRIEEII